MKRIFALLFIVLLIVAIALQSFAADTNNESETVEPEKPSGLVEYIPGKICIISDVLPEVDVASVKNCQNYLGLETENVEFIYSQEEVNLSRCNEGTQAFYVVTVDLKDKSPEAMEASLTSLKSRDDVTGAFQDCIVYHPQTYRTSPDAENNTENLGTRTNNNVWAFDRVGVDDAHSMGFHGNANIKVAVIDTGVDQTTFLQDNVAWNLAYNAFYNTVTTSIPDGNGHGTQLASIIGADDGELDFSGICGDVTIIPMKAVGEDPTVPVYDPDLPFEQASKVALAFSQAMTNNADIINYAWAVPEYVLVEIDDYLNNYNGILILSAGTERAIDAPDTAMPIYDSALHRVKCYLTGNVIIVGAIESGDTWETYCDYGWDTSNGYGVHVAAPVLHYSNSQYSYYYGGGAESATAFVTAACVLLKATATHKSNSDIVDLIKSNTEQVSSLTSYVHQGRVLNMNTIAAVLLHETRPAYSKGDLNGNGQVDAQDYAMCKRAYLGNYQLNNVQFAAADINGNGVIDVSDYTKISRFTLETYYFAP